MSLFDEIQNDLIHDVSLSTILRKAKVLAYSLGNQEFKDWVEREISGYSEGDELPSYRKFETVVMGSFSNGYWTRNSQQIAISAFPEEYRKSVSELHLIQGIRELESILDDANRSSGRQLCLSMPAELHRCLDNKVFHNLQCLAAWKVLNAHQITRVIDSTRNRLLSFLLELADLYPQLKTDTGFGRMIPDEEIRQVFHINIQGDGATVLGSEYSKYRGETMAIFDQRNQNVETQYNAARDINFNADMNAESFAAELTKLRNELREVAASQVVDGDVVTDAEYQLSKAINQAQLPTPSKGVILDHLTKAKDYVNGVEALMKVYTAINMAIAAAQSIFG